MKKIPSFVTPGLGNTLPGWIKTLRYFPGTKVSPKFYKRVVANAGIALVSAPFQLYEHLRLGKKINQTKLHDSPVFIIGHWRSGTTFLHNLLSKDEQFGFVNTMQSVFPHNYLTNFLFPAVAKVLMPPTRPMDNMALYMAAPQEEEMVLVNYGPFSYYHSWHFPGHIRSIYKRVVKFEGMSVREKSAWKQAYLHLLKKAAYASGRQRLVLKDPAHTARIPLLLELFPKARFIFIHRDPLEVYASTLKLFRNILPVFQLEEYDFEKVKRDIIWVYKDLMSTYLNDRSLLPADQLLEVSYEDFVNRPLENLRQLYEQLGLPVFAESLSNQETYLSQKRIKGYRKSEYNIPAAEIAEVEREWEFALERWYAS